MTFKKILMGMLLCAFNVGCVSAQSYVCADSLRYKPVDMVNNTCCVTGISSCRKCLIIPNEVEIKGRKFTVTYIEKGAFAYLGNPDEIRERKIAESVKYVYVGDNVHTIEGSSFFGNRNIQQVVLGKNVNTIKTWAFHRCDQIKVLVLLNPTPPSIENGEGGLNSFPFHLNEDAVVYVLDSSLERYKKDSKWSKFWNIKGLSELSNDPNFTNAQQIEAELAKDKAERNAKIAAEKEMESYRSHLKPIIEKSLTLIPFIGYSINATSKSKLANVTEGNVGHYRLTFEEGETIESVDFSKIVSDKWSVGNEIIEETSYQCLYDPTKEIALTLITKTTKSGSGDLERQWMILVDKADIHKVDKKLQKELRSKFFEGQ